MNKIWILFFPFTLLQGYAAQTDQKVAQSTSQLAEDNQIADAELLPGATLQLDFPALTVDRKDRPAHCRVRLPVGYTRDGRYPLVVWLGGADGGTQPNGSFLPEGDFVLAGLPYPKGANQPTQANMVGQFDVIWEYHRTMLDAIHQRIPNLDRSLSIIAGFSNGAHAIDGILKARAGKGVEITDYFGIFILVDGGGSSKSAGDYPVLKGKYAYCCYGEKSPAAKIVPVAGKLFQSKGAEVVVHQMDNTGHQFADFEKDNIRQWLAQKALPGLSPSP